MTVLMPGLLFSQKMQSQLAGELAAHGNRVVTFDPLGHGDSDRPQDMWRYSIGAFAEQTVALLDHLELPQAIVVEECWSDDIAATQPRAAAR